MSLSIEVEDIYFITGLSWGGEMVNLWSHGPKGGLTIDEYITVYCFSEMEKVGSQISTNSIQILGPKAILLALGSIVGLSSLHQASRPMIFYSVECIRPTVYDWSNMLLSNMKQQLNDCKMGRMWNFGFDSILSMFFFERVPGICHRV